MKLTALALAAFFSTLSFAAAPSIGVVTSAGNGERNVTDGSALKTEEAPSDVRLDKGVAVRLAPRSAGTVFADHAVLEEGAARVSNFSGYPLQAGQLVVESETPETAAVIRFKKETIEIASLGGVVRVMDGGLLTRVASGSKMAFQNSGASPGQTGASAAPKRSNETKTWLWVIGGISAAALAIGLTAAAQGKSPF